MTWKLPGINYQLADESLTLTGKVSASLQRETPPCLPRTTAPAAHRLCDRERRSQPTSCGSIGAQDSNRTP